MLLTIILKSLFMFQDTSGTQPPEPTDYWWLAFAPVVITAIIFFVTYWGFKRFLRGDRFIARIFGISKEEQEAKIREFHQKILEQQEAKEKRELG